MNDNIIKLDGRDSIELTKTTKGYTWNIKLYKMEGESTDKLLERIHDIESKLKLKYENT